MPVPRPLSRFAAAVVVAPIAGAITAFVATFFVFLFVRRAGEPIHPDGAKAAAIFSFWALLICLVYVVVIGTLAYLYTRITGRGLSLTTALVVGLIAGVIPFAIPSFGRSESLNSAIAFPALAAVCAIATAWTFWKVALASGDASL